MSRKTIEAKNNEKREVKTMENTKNEAKNNEKREVKTMENTKNEVSINNMDVLKNVNSDAMLNWIMSNTALSVARQSNELERREYDGATKVVNPMLRDYYTKSYSKLENVGDNVLLAKRKLITAIMDSDDYKSSFVNDKDFAAAIGESKTFVSKAKSCVRTLNWLIENDYGSDWTSSQLDEITPTLGVEMKKDKAVVFNTMLHVLYVNGVFNSALSARKMRELMANYLDEYNKIVAPIENIENADMVTATTVSANEKTDTVAKDTKAEKAVKKTKKKSNEYGIAKINVALTFNNGRNVAIEGTYANGKADDTYRVLSDMIMKSREFATLVKTLIENVER